MLPDQDFLILLKEGGPILLIPKSFEHGFRRILLAYAGGRFSEKALHIVALLSKFWKSKMAELIRHRSRTSSPTQFRRRTSSSSRSAKGRIRPLAKKCSRKKHAVR